MQLHLFQVAYSFRASSFISKYIGYILQLLDNVEAVEGRGPSWLKASYGRLFQVARHTGPVSPHSFTLQICSEGEQSKRKLTGLHFLKYCGPSGVLLKHRYRESPIRATGWRAVVCKMSVLTEINWLIFFFNLPQYLVR